MRRVIRKSMLWGLALGSAVGMSVIGVGCRTISARPTALEEARMAYAQVAQDPRVATYAPVTLREAEEAVRQAELAWERHKDRREAENLAAVAKRRVEVARAEAEKNMAEAEIGQLSIERERVLAETRVLDPERAQREADRTYQEVRVVTTRDTQLERELAAFEAQVRQTERGVVLTLNEVFFGPNQAVLTSGGMQRLQGLVTALQAHPERQVIIEGYADNMGAATSNRELSQRRAEAVRNFLVQQGVDARRLTAIGHGEISPVAAPNTEAGGLQNRRVEVIIAR